MKLFISIFFLLILGYYFWQYKNHNWEELCTTQNVEQYMNIVGKLQNSGIKYKTSSGGEEFNFRHNTFFSKTPPISYTVWVKKEQLYKANHLLNKQ